MKLEDVMKRELTEEMEFEVKMKDGMKFLITIKAINDVVAEEKIKEVYGDAVESVELI